MDAAVASAAEAAANGCAAAPADSAAAVPAVEVEALHVVSRWLHHSGLRDAARLVWRHAAAAAAARLPVIGAPQTLSDSSGLGEAQQQPQCADPPPLPHPTLPDDALTRLLKRAIAASVAPRRAASLSSSLPASLFHCGSQSVIPFFRSRPLHAVWNGSTAGSDGDSDSAGGQSVEPQPASPADFACLRAHSYLSPLPSLCARSGCGTSAAASSAAFGVSSFRCLKRLYGHLCAVYSVVFDQSGDFFFTGSDDHLVKVWSSRSGRLLWTLRGHAHEVTDIAVSPDNCILASASWDHSIRVWQLQREATPLHVFFHQHSNKIWRIAFHPLYRPGHRLLFSACMDGSTQVFDLDNANSRTVTLYADPRHLALPNTITAFTAQEASKRGYRTLLQPTLTSPDRQQPSPADATQQQRHQPRQAAQPHQLLDVQMTEADSAAVAADSTSESAGGLTGSSNDRSATSASAPPSAGLVPEMLCISHHPHGTEFALGSNDRCIRVYCMADKQLVALLRGHAGEIDQLHYDHNGNRLLSVDDTGEGLVWERISQLAVQQQLHTRQCWEPAAAEQPNAEAPFNGASPVGSPPLFISTAPSITRFQCVGRVRVLGAVSAQPLIAPAAGAAAGPAATAALPSTSAVLDASESAASRLLLAQPSCKIVCASWSATDSHVLTSSSDHCLRLWPTPPAGRGDELFAAECKRAAVAAAARRRRRRSGSNADAGEAAGAHGAEDGAEDGSVVLPSSKRSFIASVPLMQPSATFRLHSADVAVLRPHPHLPFVVLTAGHDGRVALWDVSAQRLLLSFLCPTEAKPGELSPAVARFVDGSWSPSGDLCALSDDDGKVWLFGAGSRIAYQLAPTEQFYQSDYAPITLDADGWVIDSNSQLPPHLMPDRTAVLIQASGQPYEPQPSSGTTPDSRVPSIPSSYSQLERIQDVERNAADEAASVEVGSAQHLSSHSHPSVLVTVAAALQADVARASRLAAIRMERRQRWQQSVLSSNSMAAHAARQRRQAEEGEEGLWNERFDLVDEQLHLAGDVEVDLADDDDLLDATVERRPWHYETALVTGPTARPAQHPLVPAAAPVAGRAASTLSEAYDDWWHAQRLVEAELAALERDEDSRDGDYQPDDHTQHSAGSSGGRGASLNQPPQRSSSRLQQQQQHHHHHQQAAQLREARDPALSLVSLSAADLLAAEQAAMDAVVARDIRAVQRAERRARMAPGDVEAADSREVGEDTPLQLRIRPAGPAGSGNGRTRRNGLSFASRQRAASRRIEYKEDDWDLPMDDGDSDSSLSRDGDEWREDEHTQRAYYSDEDKEEDEDEDEEAGGQHDRAQRGSRGRRRRASQRGRRRSQRREHDEQLELSRESTPQLNAPPPQQPTRSSHRLAERAQHVHAMEAEEAHTVSEPAAQQTANGYHGQFRRSKRTRHNATAQSSDGYDERDSANEVSSHHSDTTQGHDSDDRAHTLAHSDEHGPSTQPAATKPSSCRHRRGDEYRIVRIRRNKQKTHNTRAAAAFEEDQADHDHEADKDHTEEAAADMGEQRPTEAAAPAATAQPASSPSSSLSLTITLRRLARLEWSDEASAVEDGAAAAMEDGAAGEGSDEGQVVTGVGEVGLGSGAEPESGLAGRRGRSRTGASHTAVSSLAAAGVGSKRVRILFHGEQVGTLSLQPASDGSHAVHEIWSSE